MATVGQVYYRVLDNNSGTFISSGIDIYHNIVPAYNNASQFNKLGIQAPPGTQVVMNDSKTIMVGRTGMYELDANIPVTSLYFVQPKNYVKNTEKSNQAINDGSDGMREAESVRATALATLGAEPPKTNVAAYEAYWSSYASIQETYMTSYSQALDTYNKGVNGIYELDGTNPNKELDNVIIDFIYE